MFQEHEKRCWSVDFNRMDPKMLASGSDDTKGDCQEGISCLVCFLFIYLLIQYFNASQILMQGYVCSFTVIDLELCNIMKLVIIWID